MILFEFLNGDRVIAEEGYSELAVRYESKVFGLICREFYVGYTFDDIKIFRAHFVLQSTKLASESFSPVQLKDWIPF